MAMFKSPVLLLLLTLFLSSAFLSLGLHLRSPREELSELLTESNPDSPRREYEHCQQRCQEEQGQARQEKCQQQCEQRLRKREQQGEDDPRQRYEQCQQRCHREQQDRRQQRQCQQMCQREFEERPEEKSHREELRKQYEQCKERCQGQHQSQRKQQQCKERCQGQHQSQRKQQQCQRTCKEQLEEQEENYKSEQEQQSNRPFFIRSQWFQPQFKSGQGHVRVLPRFNQRSPLLRGIKNHRLSLIEAYSNTFVVPHHCDSESLFVVVRGEGTITFVGDEGRQSFNMKYGSVIRAPAGTTVYMVNSESNDKFIIAAINEPVNAPGHLQEFVLGGGEKAPYYLNPFSNEILEPSFNAFEDQIRRVVSGQWQEGRILKASKKQLKALSAQASSSPRHSRSVSPIELLNQHPLYSNKNGRFHEACPEVFKQLRNMDVSVSSLQMNKDSIFLPHFNSKQTTLLLITEGSVEFEMVSPKLRRKSQEEQSEDEDDDEDEDGDEEHEEEEEQEQEQEHRSGQYQTVTATANPGDLLIFPAGYPVTFVTSQNENMKAIGFGINAKNNRRIFLAGLNNIVRHLEKEAQELSFGVSARLVERVFNNQKDSNFVPASQ